MKPRTHGFDGRYALSVIASDRRERSNPVEYNRPLECNGIASSSPASSAPTRRGCPRNDWQTLNTYAVRGQQLAAKLPVSLPLCSPSARALGRLDRGFTLIELLIVIIILGVLAALAVPRLAGRTEEARIQAAKADIEGGVGVALDLYEMDMGRYPASLEDLVAKPAAADRWKGPYLKKGRIPLDPWKNAYVYSFPASHNKSDYDLSSTGPDGMEGSEDDITNWSQ